MPNLNALLFQTLMKPLYNSVETAWYYAAAWVNRNTLGDLPAYRTKSVETCNFLYSHPAASWVKFLAHGQKMVRRIQTLALRVNQSLLFAQKKKTTGTSWVKCLARVSVSYKSIETSKYLYSLANLIGWGFELTGELKVVSQRNCA